MDPPSDTYIVPEYHPYLTKEFFHMIRENLPDGMREKIKTPQDYLSCVDLPQESVRGVFVLIPNKEFIARLEKLLVTYEIGEKHRDIIMAQKHFIVTYLHATDDFSGILSDNINQKIKIARSKNEPLTFHVQDFYYICASKKHDKIAIGISTKVSVSGEKLYIILGNNWLDPQPVKKEFYKCDMKQTESHMKCSFWGSDLKRAPVGCVYGTDCYNN